jgi:cytochrome c553
LLADTRSASEIQRWLTEGDAETPAYGEVLDERDLSDLTAFLVKTRDGELAHPDNIFQLKAAAPEDYVLLGGADPARGRELYGYTCANCHGDDGRELTLDGMQSVGTLSRSIAYEVWFKIQHGLAGSPMKAQVLEKTGAESSQTVLDLLAALCDRKTFPALRGRDAADVQDGDARCGAYLK